MNHGSQVTYLGTTEENREVMKNPYYSAGIPVNKESLIKYMGIAQKKTKENIQNFLTRYVS